MTVGKLLEKREVIFDKFDGGNDNVKRTTQQQQYLLFVNQSITSPHHTPFSKAHYYCLGGGTFLLHLPLPLLLLALVVLHLLGGVVVVGSPDGS